MQMDIDMNKDLIRERLLEYTREAFRMLPRLDKPRILDVGCGSGVPTMELARLSDGEIIGMDIDEELLDVLRGKIEKAGVSDRVKAVKCSILNMEFPDESFDIIWSEGSIYAISFERGLREWKRFLKPAGFMVVHDEQGNVKGKLEQIFDCDYELLGYFILSKETWLVEYFVPLEKWIAESEIKYTNDPNILEEIQQAHAELDMFKKNPERNSSVYFIMKIYK